MKQFIIAILGAVFVTFLASIIFKNPNIFLIAVGIPIFLACLYFGFTKKIGLGFITLILGVLFVTGGMQLQSKIVALFEPKEVQAASLENNNKPWFIIDRQEPAQAASANEKSIPVATIDPTTCVYYDRYPANIKQWCGYIELESAKYSLDPLLVAAVIQQESGGDAHAGYYTTTVDGVTYNCSADGAIGLMQVMPSDGLAQAKYGSLFAGRPTVKELYDPATNIHEGVKILAGKIAAAGDYYTGVKNYGPQCYVVDCDPYQYVEPVFAIYNGL